MIKIKSFALILLISGLLSSSPCYGSQLVKVALFQEQPQKELVVLATGSFTITDKITNKVLAESPPQRVWKIEITDGKVKISYHEESYVAEELSLSDLYPSTSRFWTGKEDASLQSYRGHLEIKVKDGYPLTINVLPLEEYLLSVAPSEMPPDWPKEALKAQATAARTYALKNLERHKKDGFNFCDTTHCQMYLGAKTEKEATSKAVIETEGEIIAFKEKPALALYHSTCAGKTAANDKVFSGPPLPYLQGVEDKGKEGDFCKNSPYYTTWKIKSSKEELLKILKENPKGSPCLSGRQAGSYLNDIVISETDPTGRATKIKISGEKEASLSGYDFFLALQKMPDKKGIKSTLFTIRKENDDFIFEGRGLGHGVGMCQWGAKGMAEDGYKYSEIIKHYYPGVEVRKCSTL